MSLSPQSEARVENPHHVGRPVPPGGGDGQRTARMDLVPELLDGVNPPRPAIGRAEVEELTHGRQPVRDDRPGRVEPVRAHALGDLDQLHAGEHGVLPEDPQSVT